MNNNLERIKENAELFAQAAFLLEEKNCEIQKSAGKESMFSSLYIPIMVLKAFSCELFLKYKISFDYEKVDKRADNHALDILFKKMDGEEKKRIREIIIRKMQMMIPDYDEKHFDIDLKNIAGTFKDWRYFYDKDEIQIKFVFLFAFFDTLREETK